MPRFATRPSPRLALVALGLTGAIAVSGSALAKPAGELDRSFGRDGTVLRDLGDDDSAEALVTQPDGKVVTASTVIFRRDAAIQVNRFLADGSIDRRFGNSGRRILALPGDERYPSLALTTGGRIAISFEADTRGAPLGIARLTRRGAQDQSFDGDGIQTLGYGAEVSNGGAPVDLAADAEGGLVVASYASIDATGPEFAALRVGPSGQLDQDFGDDGLALTDVSPDFDYPTSVTVDPEERVVIAGGGEEQIGLVRLTADGEQDPAFGGGDGAARSPLMRNAEDVTALPGGSLAVAGSVAGDFGVARFTAAGEADPGFSGDGLAQIDFADSTDAATQIDHDGDLIVAAGEARTQRRGYDFGVARLTATGAPDRTFSADGRRAIDFGRTADSAQSLGIGRRGAILAGGYVERGRGDDRFDTGLVRLLGRRG